MSMRASTWTVPLACPPPARHYHSNRHLTQTRHRLLGHSHLRCCARAALRLSGRSAHTHQGTRLQLVTTAHLRSTHCTLTRGRSPIGTGACPWHIACPCPCNLIKALVYLPMAVGILYFLHTLWLVVRRARAADLASCVHVLAQASHRWKARHYTLSRLFFYSFSFIALVSRPPTLLCTCYTPSTYCMPYI